MSTSSTFGPYLLLERIASGGMAEVFLAKHGDEPDGAPLVVKRILPHLQESPEVVEMFLDELRLSSLLHHGNIVRVFDYGEVEETHFIAMEYVDGISLRQLQQGLGHLRLPLALACWIAAEVCSALSYAHSLQLRYSGQDLGIVHRDVSPHNILLSRTGDVKLADFGVAKAAMRLTSTDPGMVKGKWAYMSPEQVTEGKLDRRSDLFSLGVVLYELTTGRRVFPGAGAEILEALTDRRYTPPENVVPGYPEPLAAIVNKALQWDPDGRYQDAAVMRDQIAQLVPGGEQLSETLARLVRRCAPERSLSGGLAAERPNTETTVSLPLDKRIADTRPDGGSRSLSGYEDETETKPNDSDGAPAPPEDDSHWQEGPPDPTDVDPLGQLDALQDDVAAPPDGVLTAWQTGPVRPEAASKSETAETDIYSAIPDESPPSTEPPATQAAQRPPEDASGLDLADTEQHPVSDDDIPLDAAPMEQTATDEITGLSRRAPRRMRLLAGCAVVVAMAATALVAANFITVSRQVTLRCSTHHLPLRELRAARSGVVRRAKLDEGSRVARGAELMSIAVDADPARQKELTTRLNEQQTRLRRMLLARRRRVVRAVRRRIHRIARALRRIRRCKSGRCERRRTKLEQALHKSREACRFCRRPPGRADIAAQRKRVRLTRRELAELKRPERVVITAPRAGIVTRLAAAGSHVTKGDTIAALADPDQMQVTVPIGADRSCQLASDTVQVVLTSNARRKRFVAHVSSCTANRLVGRLSADVTAFDTDATCTAVLALRPKKLIRQLIR